MMGDSSADGLLAGFPRRRVLVGALKQTRDDALSLRGVFATAVALGLTNEVFPDAAGTDLGHRAWHGLVVVVATLLALGFIDLAQRLAFYRRRCRRAWTIRQWRAHGLLGFAIDTAGTPGGYVPYPLRFVVRTPVGRFLTPLPNTPDAESNIIGYPTGTWAFLIEPDSEQGEYQVRVYEYQPLRELARDTLDVHW